MADPIQLVLKLVDQVSPALKQIERGIAETQQQFAKAGSAFGGAFSAIKTVTDQTKELFGSLSFVSLGFNQITQAISTLANSARPAYDLLVGQNERLNASILSSASSIAATSKVLINGVAAGPKEAIQALQEPLRQALLQVQKDSVDLVGVTSGQLTETFQILTSQVNTLAGQSKNIGSPIAAAGKLTIDFAAALGTLGIPLNQSRQELSSILNQSIDQNSVLAKSLNITNQQVQAWKAQGVLVDKLRERLQPFLEGNKLAAQSIAAIGSNLQDLVELTTRAAGEQLLKPIVQGLQVVYDFLKDKQPQIEAYLSQTINAFLQLGQQIQPIVEALKPVFVSLGQTLLSLGDTAITSFIGSLRVALTVLGVVAKAIAPILTASAELARVFAEFAGSDIGRIVVLAAALTAGFYALLPALAGAVAAFTTMIPVVAGATFSLSTLSAALPVLAANLQAALAPLIAAAAPVAAVGAAIGLVALGLQSMVMADANEAVDTMANSTNRLADESLGYASKLKALQDQEKAGKALTQDQIKQRQLLIQQSADIRKSIDGQIADLKSLTQSDAIKAQITLLEQRKELLTNQSGVTTQVRDLENLGSTYEQLEKKVKNAQTMMAQQGGGDPERYKAAAKELIDLTQQQVELGKLTAEQGAERLREISNNAKVDIEIQRKARQEALKLELTDAEQQYKESAAKIQTLRANDQISEAEADKESLEAKKQSAEEKLEASKAALNADPDNKELKTKAAEAEAEAAQAAKKVRDEAFKQVLLSFDREQSVLNGKRAQGLVNEEQYNAESLEITRSKLDAEQQEVNRQRATMTDQKGLQELAAKEGEIQKKRVEALKKFEDERLNILEKYQKKALDAVKLAETQREIETQKLLNLNVIRSEEANQRGLESKAKTIQKELELEQEKADEIERLPSLSDPALEEQRQAKIRGSRQRTAELTSQLLKNQADIDAARTKVVQDKIDRELRRLTNTYTKQEQSLGRLGQAQDLVAKSIERQNDLLNAQKDLQQAISSYVEGEYRIAEELTVSEGKKRRIREEAARKRLEFLQKEQILEGLSLELELAKNKALIERERIQNKIDQSKAKSEVAGAQADLAKTLVDKKALPEEVEAKKLALQAAQDKLTGVNEQGQLIEQQARQEGLLDKFKRRKLELQQSLQTDQAEAALAKETRTKSDDRAVSARSLERARLFQDGLPDLTSSIRAELEKEKQRSNVNRLETVQTSTPGKGGNVAVNDPSKAFNAAIDRLVTQKKSEDVKIEQQNTITFNLAGGNAMNESQEQLKSLVFSGLYDALRTAKNKAK